MNEQFYVRLTNTTKINPDGTDRQEVIRQYLMINRALTLVPAAIGWDVTAVVEVEGFTL